MLFVMLPADTRHSLSGRHGSALPPSTQSSPYICPMTCPALTCPWDISPLWIMVLQTGRELDTQQWHMAVMWSAS